MSNVLIDILIRVGDVRIAVEYDGSFWHSQKEAIDTLKTEALLADGFLVVRIRENDLIHSTIDNSNLFQVSHKFIKINSIKEIQRRDESVMATCNEIATWIQEQTGGFPFT